MARNPPGCTPSGPPTAEDCSSCRTWRRPRPTTRPTADRSWSSEAPELQYLGFSKPGRLFVMNTDGSGVRQITPPGSADAPADHTSWSPDGRWIAFTTGGNIAAIYVVHPDGTGLHQLEIDPSAGLVNVFGPAWSPDGEYLAFQGWDGEPDLNIDLYVARAERLPCRADHGRDRLRRGDRLDVRPDLGGWAPAPRAQLPAEPEPPLSGRAVRPEVGCIHQRGNSGPGSDARPYPSWRAGNRGSILKSQRHDAPQDARGIDAGRGGR